MERRILILLTILFAFITPHAFATNYYVNGSTGDDAYNGLYESHQGGYNGPWKTLGKANTSVTSGTHTINVAAGTYNEDITETHSGTSSSHFLHWKANGAVNIGGYFAIKGNYVKLEGFTISHQDMASSKGAINIEGNNAYITTNIIRNCTRPGIRTYPGTSGTIIYDNIIMTIVQIGIWAQGSNHTIENNDISDVRDQYLGQSLGGDANGIEIGGAENSGTVIRANYIHDIIWENQSGLPHIDAIQRNSMGGTTSSNVTVEKNHIYLWQEAKYGGGTSYGMMLGGCNNWTIKNNIIEAWGGINTSNTGRNLNMKIFNNTLRSNISWVNNYGGHAVNMDGGSNNVAYNNIAINFRSSKRGASMFSNSPSNNGGFTGDNNLFWQIDGTTTKFTGYTKGPNDIDNVDPEFVDNFDDLRLQSNSPCIDTGHTITTVIDDYEGTPRPQGDGFDIGAFEFHEREKDPPSPPTGLRLI